MKVIRLGMTESGLLFLSYVNNLKNINPTIRMNIQKCLLSLTNWLYTTSGYYDKSVVGNKFNFNNTAMNKNFFKFINQLKDCVRNCDEAQFMFHNGFIMNLFLVLKNDFLKTFCISNFRLINKIRLIDLKPSIFDYIRNQRVLVISSFSGLIDKQYQSGNIWKIDNKFPEIKSLCTITTPYCFLNNGPHSNYHETLEYIFKLIENKKNNFDIALLGCGCYGHMLTHNIHNKLGKDAYYIGSNITTLFGILSKRESNTVTSINEYWITEIPDEYKPKCYKDIENGCYW